MKAFSWSISDTTLRLVALCMSNKKEVITDKKHSVRIHRRFWPTSNWKKKNPDQQERFVFLKILVAPRYHLFPTTLNRCHKRDEFANFLGRTSWCRGAKKLRKCSWNVQSIHAITAISKEAYRTRHITNQKNSVKVKLEKKDREQIQRKQNTLMTPPQNTHRPWNKKHFSKIPPVVLMICTRANTVGKKRHLASDHFSLKLVNGPQDGYWQHD